MARKFVLQKDTSTSEIRFTIDYAKHLNKQQYAAVTAGAGPHLVIAGAGTGKTRTLVYRVAYLVESGVAPEQILLLTFTRRAAREMLQRATSLLDGRCERVQGGTFHAFSLSLLRQYAPLLGYERNFTILDASDAADVIDLLRTTRGFHRKERRFPRKKVLQSLFSAARNRQCSLTDVVLEEYSQFADLIPQFELLLADYAAYKQKHNLMDYDDLLEQAYRLLSEHGDVRRKVSRTYRYILVDEYQDTNRIQAQLVQLLASEHGNVMAVGDDAQSIYRFRGADYRNMFSFPEHFPEARILKLEENYRSTQPILDVANTVLKQATRKYDKQLFSRKKEGDLPALVLAGDDRMQSRFVAQMVLTLRESGIPLHRMAVLFRRSFDAYDVEAELNRRGIPYVKYGGMKMTEAAHIKDLLAHLRVLENPSDTVAWNRVLQLLEGIGPKTARDLIEWIVARGDFNQPLVAPRASARYVESLRRLSDVLLDLRQRPRSLREEIDSLITYYQPLLRRTYYEDYSRREQDLERFAEIAGTFSSRQELLSTLTLDPVEYTELEAKPEIPDEPPLVLSTIHSAKGLEFHTVFLIHALDGILPSRYALQDEESLDEELRLLYVAITRAEEQLFISYPVFRFQRWGDTFARPSRFLDAIPEEQLERWELVEEEAEPSPDRELLP